MLVLPKHTPRSAEQKREKMGCRAGNCILWSDFPMEQQREKGKSAISNVTKSWSKICDKGVINLVINLY